MNTTNEANGQEQGDNDAASEDGRNGGTAPAGTDPKGDAVTDSKGRTIPPPGQRAFEEGNESDSRSIEAGNQSSGGGQLSQGGSSERSSQK